MPLVFALVGSAQAADVSGILRIVGGDTLAIGDVKIRLEGIDAARNRSGLQMLELAVQIVAIGGPPLLAVIAAILVDYSPKTIGGRLACYAALFVIALAAVLAAVADARRQQERLVTMIMGGGDNYPEIFGTPRADGKLELLIVSGKGTPLYDVTFSIMKALTFNIIVVRNWGTLLSGATDTGIALEQGIYQINFNAKNGPFIEMLLYRLCNGRLTQSLSITKPVEGQVMMQSPDYEDCVSHPEGRISGGSSSQPEPGTPEKRGPMPLTPFWFLNP